MNGDGTLFLGGDDARAPLQATDNAIDSVVEVFLLNVFLGMTGGDEGCFVTDIGDVGARKTGGEFGEIFQIDILAEFQLSDMNGKDILPFGKTG